VLFDLGGVVLGSPLHAIAGYERSRSLPLGFINRVVVDCGPAGAWARLERGELDVESFLEPFERDCASAGQSISARELMAAISESSGPRAEMLEAIRRIRSRDLRVGALTNNWVSGDRESAGSHGLAPLFDVFVESSVVGLRKPDPRIYRHACDEIGTVPEETVFLDDIGRNLKPARQLGMTTIKVDDPIEALEQLEDVLGFALLADRSSS
jgi:putative hydrolase of the HAD superfamily